MTKQKVVVGQVVALSRSFGNSRFIAYSIHIGMGYTRKFVADKGDLNLDDFVFVVKSGYERPTEFAGIAKDAIVRSKHFLKLCLSDCIAIKCGWQDSRLYSIGEDVTHRFFPLSTNFAAKRRKQVLLGQIVELSGAGLEQLVFLKIGCILAGAESSSIISSFAHADDFHCLDYVGVILPGFQTPITTTLIGKHIFGAPVQHYNDGNFRSDALVVKLPHGFTGVGMHPKLGSDITDWYKYPT